MISQAKILWLIRQNEPIDYFELIKLASKEYTANDPVAMRLREQYQRQGIPVKSTSVDKRVVHEVDLLIQTGLVVVKDDSGHKKRLSTNSQLTSLLSVLNISLTELVSKIGYRHIVFPTFGRPLNDSAQFSDIFVAMPFREHLAHIYEDDIRIAVENIGLTCKRGDDFLTTRAIMQEVWSSILYSKICIFDCTGMNANVFYELGIAHTVGVKTILIAQSEDDIPFDIRHLRYIIYEDSEEGLAKFRETLKATVQSELGLSE